MEPVFYTNKEYRELLSLIDSLTMEAENSPFPQVKEIVTSILKHFDLIHREPLARLINLIENSHPDLRSKLEEDYTIKTLFNLYDLIEGDIERNPMDHPNTVGFIPVNEVGLMTRHPVLKKNNPSK